MNNYIQQMFCLVINDHIILFKYKAWLYLSIIMYMLLQPLIYTEYNVQDLSMIKLVCRCYLLKVVNEILCELASLYIYLI